MEGWDPWTRHAQVEIIVVHLSECVHQTDGLKPAGEKDTQKE